MDDQRTDREGGAGHKSGYLKYERKVRDVVQSCQSVLTTREVAECEQLISHGEPAEGLRALAWIITEKRNFTSRKYDSGNQRVDRRPDGPSGPLT